MESAPAGKSPNDQGQNPGGDQQLSEEEREKLQWFTAVEQAFPALYRRLRNLLVEYAHDIHPDLDGAGYLLLVQIRHRAPIRAAQLVERSNTDKSAISRQVRLLLDLRLIDRVADPDDSRAYLLVPTEEGEHRIDQLQATRLHRLQATLPHLAELLEAVFVAIAEDSKTS